MPDVETWTSFGSQTPKQPVRRLGLNLAAPGDRKADDGTLWLEYPSVGGSSPAVDGEDRARAARVVPPAQLAGLRPRLQLGRRLGREGAGLAAVKLAEAGAAARKYTVRLHFLEPDDVQPGERLFSVSVQGKKLLPSLDVVKEAGGRNRSLVKEITGVMVADELVIDLTPDPAAKIRSSILSGIEMHAEGW